MIQDTSWTDLLVNPCRLVSWLSMNNCFFFFCLVIELSKAAFILFFMMFLDDITNQTQKWGLWTCVIYSCCFSVRGLHNICGLLCLWRSKTSFHSRHFSEVLHEAGNYNNTCCPHVISDTLTALISLLSSVFLSSLWRSRSKWICWYCLAWQPPVLEKVRVRALSGAVKLFFLSCCTFRQISCP